jgi:hypothetical protein
MVSSNLWGVELWGKSLTNLWGTVKDGKGKAVVSYPFDKLPEAIQQVPCALSFFQGDSMDVDYSMGGLSEAKWRGFTEFHLSQDIRKTSESYVWQFYRQIVTAAAKSLTLNGLVQEFILVPAKSIELSVLTYGAETEHWGLVVHWTILESLVGKVTVGA